MIIRQLALIVGIVLIISCQTNAGISLSISKAAGPVMTGQDSSISISTPWSQLDFPGNNLEFDTIPPADPASYHNFVTVAESLSPFEIRSIEMMHLNAHISVFLTKDVFLTPLRSTRFIFDVPEQSNSLFQQVLVMGPALKNVAIPNGGNRLSFEIDDTLQSNLGELNFAVHSIPAPAVILIGSIAVGIVGWMRISRTYTV